MAAIYSKSIVGDGRYSVSVVGTSHYQQNIRSLLDGDDLTFHFECEAELISEPSNQYDSRAIKVKINEKRVGYLSRELAGAIGKWLQSQGFAYIRCSCPAMVLGPTVDDEQIDGWNLGIRLDFVFPDSKVNKTGLNNPTLFSPALQGKIIDGHLCTDDERLLLKDGDPVSFWLNRHNPIFINIYASGGMGGSGRIGVVPQSHYPAIFSHLENGLPIDSWIHKVENGNCEIQFHLVSREEHTNRLREFREAQIAALMKPLTQSSKITAMACCITPTIKKLKKGDRLFVTKIPTLEECLDRLNQPSVNFSTKDGAIQFSCDKGELERKLFRARDYLQNVSVTISKKLRGHSNLYEVEVRIPKAGKQLKDKSDV